MKLVGFTQRVDFHSSYGERRDALDHRWIHLCRECEILPIPLPNDLAIVIELLKRIQFEGFILTGGNTLHAYGGDAPERDEVEKALLEFALEKKLPLLGICRGMQFIQHFFGAPLFKIDGHVKRMHAISLEDQTWNVNSFHDYGTWETVPELSVLARAEDGVVEAIQHRSGHIHGMMWHPERNEQLNFFDKQWILRVFEQAAWRNGLSGPVKRAL